MSQLEPASDADSASDAATDASPPPSSLDEVSGPTATDDEPDSTTPSESVNADRLEDLNGIGPTYATRLRDAGIQTFASLAELGPERLRQILKPKVWDNDRAEQWCQEAARLANE